MAVAEVNESAAPWVSVTELARLKNVSPAAISKRVKRLRETAGLETSGEGRTLRINLVHFDRLIGETTDPAQELRNPSGKAKGGAASQADSPESGSYSAARSLRENYQAEHARLDLEERLGRLTLTEDVVQRNFAAARRARDRLLGLPGRLADKVISAPDARAVRMLLDREIRAVLDRLADELEGKEPVDDDAA